jgi:hypothetical protein
MDLSGYTHEQIHTAVSTGVAQIHILWLQIHSILVNSEWFDAELSLQTIEAMQEFTKKLDILQRDSLHKMGYTDEMIDEQIKIVRKALGLD